ncbi:hypothetical protein G7046_g2972 [Stylonectria norvegica]|nr:hypothetical protein G7046_g2972 [Stylonectria norvegica]
MSSAQLPQLQDGSPIPKIIYGTSTHPYPQPQPNIVSAIKHGYRGIDSASTRKFHNEPETGFAIQRAHQDGHRIVDRKSLLIQTKCTSPRGHPDDQTTWPYDIVDAPSVRVYKSFLRSVEDLLVENIDVYFLHGMLDTLVDTLEAWHAMETLHAHGAIRYLGICNVQVPDLENLWSATTTKPVFVQNSLVYREGLHPGWDVDVVKFCREKGIVYETFGIFSPQNASLLSCEPVKALAKLGLTAHQALIRLLVEAAASVELPFSILDGTTSEKHMKENMKAVESDVVVDMATVYEFREFLGWHIIPL